MVRATYSWLEGLPSDCRGNEAKEYLIILQTGADMPRLCEDGAKGTCFGPWWACAMFGCAVNSPRPTKKEALLKEQNELLRRIADSQERKKSPRNSSWVTDWVRPLSRNPISSV